MRLAKSVYIQFGNKYKLFLKRYRIYCIWQVYILAYGNTRTFVLMDNINLQKDHLIRICVNFNNPTNLHENLNISRNTAHKTSPLSFETTEKPSWHKSLICAYQFPEIALRPLFSRKLKTTYKKKIRAFSKTFRLSDYMPFFRGRNQEISCYSYSYLHCSNAIKLWSPPGLGLNGWQRLSHSSAPKKCCVFLGVHTFKGFFRWSLFFLLEKNFRLRLYFCCILRMASLFLSGILPEELQFAGVSSRDALVV